jgi:hypothetical protein
MTIAHHMLGMRPNSCRLSHASINVNVGGCKELDYRPNFGLPWCNVSRAKTFDVTNDRNLLMIEPFSVSLTSPACIFIFYVHRSAIPTHSLVRGHVVIDASRCNAGV